jgi:amino acid transporter
VATALTTAAILLLAVSGSLASLATATSLIMLLVFSLVNLALLHIKRKHPRPEGLIVFPVLIPLLGFVVSAAFIVLELISLFSI